jgi:hypothetical protein
MQNPHLAKSASIGGTLNQKILILPAKPVPHFGYR